MLQTTSQAVKSILSADPSVSPDERRHILSTIRNGATPPAAPPPIGPRLLRRKQAAEMLACCPRTVDNLVRSGALSRVVLPGRTRAAGFRASDLARL